MTCSQELLIRGKPYPKSCKTCGLGPCTGSARHVVALEKLTAKLKSEIIMSQEPNQSQALIDVLAEMDRQYVTEEHGGEDYSPIQDDINNADYQMAWAALSYVYHYVIWPEDHPNSIVRRKTTPAPLTWKWNSEHWKPKTPRRDLVRAVALLIREIERIDRKK